MSGEEYTKTIWNFDDERCKTIEAFLELCERSLFMWFLEDAYRALRALKITGSPVLGPDDKKDAKQKLMEIERVRREYYGMDPDSNRKQEKKAEYHYKMEELYEELAQGFQEAGLMFRRGEDPRGAALKR